MDIIDKTTDLSKHCLRYFYVLNTGIMIDTFIAFIKNTHFL